MAMANKRNTYIVRFITMALLAIATLSSCERKPLYLQATGQIDVEVGVYDIELQYIWGTEWVTEWQYEWDEAEYGTPAPAPQIRALSTDIAFVADGVRVDIDAYNINNYNYFKLRDLAALVNGTA